MGEFQIKLYDMFGKLILDISTSNLTVNESPPTLQTTKLSSGIYTVVAENEREREHIIQKVILNK